MYGTNISGKKPAIALFKEEVPSTLKNNALVVSNFFTAIYQTTGHIILETSNSETNGRKNLISHSSVGLQFETSEGFRLNLVLGSTLHMYGKLNFHLRTSLRA